jgi:TRAP-type transport system periplasmic protein
MKKVAFFLFFLMFSQAGDCQELKLATLAPDGSNWMNEFRLAADQVSQETEQRVRVRFYPGGVMGDANAVLRRMRLGQLQGGAFTLGDLAPVAAAVNLYSLPFVFEDEEEVQMLRSQFDPLILAALADAGIEAPGLSMGGFAYLFAREPFPGPDALSTSWRVWVPTSDVLSRRTLEATGASPVPLALAEVYTSLQTGMINTFASTPAAAIILQWHTRARHMLDLPVLMTAGTIGFDQRAMSRLQPTDRDIVMSAFAAALERLEASNRRENQQAREALVAQGIRIATPTGEQIESWQAIAEQTRRNLIAGGQVEVPHLDELEQQLERLRE